jgi:AcrR family transcriptional regulator
LYHHFPSKEDIALRLLGSLDSALQDLARRATTTDTPPELAIRRFAQEVATLSFDHAAAVRMSVYEAPTAATERLRLALQTQSVAHERVWRNLVGSMAKTDLREGVDAGLLRFALQTLTLDASVNYPTDMVSADVSDHLCDVLLRGMAIDCPDNDALDDSAASEAAAGVIGDWRHRGQRTGITDKDKIVGAAREEFARRGYEATTIRDIANTADVRMGTLYRRVESKDALLLQIINEYSGSLDEAYKAVLTAGSPETEALDALARVFVRASRRFSQELRIVKFGWSGRENPSSPFHVYFEQSLRRRQLISTMLRRGITAGTLRRIATPEEMALHFRSVLWLPFHNFGRTSATQAHVFSRQALLRGAALDR